MTAGRRIDFHEVDHFRGFGYDLDWIAAKLDVQPSSLRTAVERRERRRQAELARAREARPTGPRSVPPPAPAVPGPDGLMPCGTAAARRRHRRRGEPVCDACRAAHVADVSRFTSQAGVA